MVGLVIGLPADVGAVELIETPLSVLRGTGTPNPVSMVIYNQFFYSLRRLRDLNRHRLSRAMLEPKPLIASLRLEKKVANHMSLNG
jgi:hypothetical protein